MQPKAFKYTALALGVTLALSACSEAPVQEVSDPTIWPEIGSPVGLDAEMEARISNLIAEMTLAQKVAQGPLPGPLIGPPHHHVRSPLQGAP